VRSRFGDTGEARSDGWVQRDMLCGWLVPTQLFADATNQPATLRRMRLSGPQTYASGFIRWVMKTVHCFHFGSSILLWGDRGGTQVDDKETAATQKYVHLLELQLSLTEDFT
jgi:hypothetical protein